MHIFCILEIWLAWKIFHWCIRGEELTMEAARIKIMNGKKMNVGAVESRMKVTKVMMVTVSSRMMRMQKKTMKKTYVC